MKKLYILYSLLFIGTFSACNLNNNTDKSTIIETDNFIMMTNLPDKFNKSILKNCEMNLKGYKEVFGINLYKKNKTKIFAIIDKTKKTSLYIYPNTSPVEIHLDVSNISSLNRPQEGGCNNIFGFAHELGHEIMLFDDNDFSEAFAIYFGIKIVDYLGEQLGSIAWPYPYDYVKNEGSGMIEKMKSAGNHLYWQKIVIGFNEIDQTYGKKCIVTAIESVKNITSPKLFFMISNGRLISLELYKKEDLINALKLATGNNNIGYIFDK